MDIDSTATEGPSPHGAGTPDKLSRRQAEALAVIRGHVAQHGYPPSVRELAQALGLRSASSAHHLLIKLETKGHIRRRGRFARALDVQPRQLPSDRSDVGLHHESSYADHADR